jgi:hypothetical protein
MKIKIELCFIMFALLGSPLVHASPHSEFLEAISHLRAHTKTLKRGASDLPDPSILQEMTSQMARLNQAWEQEKATNGALVREQTLAQAQRQFEDALSASLRAIEAFHSQSVRAYQADLATDETFASTLGEAITRVTDAGATVQILTKASHTPGKFGEIAQELQSLKTDLSRTLKFRPDEQTRRGLHADREREARAALEKIEKKQKSDSSFLNIFKKGLLFWLVASAPVLASAQASDNAFFQGIDSPGSTMATAATQQLQDKETSLLISNLADPSHFELVNQGIIPAPAMGYPDVAVILDSFRGKEPPNTEQILEAQEQLQDVVPSEVPRWRQHFHFSDQLSMTHKEIWEPSNFEMMESVRNELKAGKLPSVLVPNVKTAIDQLRRKCSAQPVCLKLIQHAENSIVTRTDPGFDFYLKFASLSGRPRVTPQYIAKEDGNYLITFEETSIEAFNRMPPDLHIVGGTTLDTVTFDNILDAVPFQLFAHDVTHAYFQWVGFKRYAKQMKMLYGVEYEAAVHLIRETQRRFAERMKVLSGDNSKTGSNTAKAVEALLFDITHETCPGAPAYGEQGWNHPGNMLRRFQEERGVSLNRNSCSQWTRFHDLKTLSSNQIQFDAPTQERASEILSTFLQSEKKYYPNKIASNHQGLVKDLFETEGEGLVESYSWEPKSSAVGTKELAMWALRGRADVVELLLQYGIVYDGQVYPALFNDVVILGNSEIVALLLKDSRLTPRDLHRVWYQATKEDIKKMIEADPRYQQG